MIFYKRQKNDFCVLRRSGGVIPIKIYVRSSQKEERGREPCPRARW